MPSTGNICVGDLEVRPRERAVVVHGEEVTLSSREFEIVLALAEHPGWVLSAVQLAGPDENDCSPESVSVLVSRLRHKLATVGAEDVVETVRGVGYRLSPAPSVGRETPEGIAKNRELRDAMWQLQEAVIETERSGSPKQQFEVVEVLGQARRAVYRHLAE